MAPLAVFLPSGEEEGRWNPETDEFEIEQRDIVLIRYLPVFGIIFLVLVAVLLAAAIS
jgi:hypothetical protein